MAIRGLALTPRIKLSILIFDAILYFLVIAGFVYFRTQVGYELVLQAEAFWFQLLTILSISYLLGSYDVDESKFSRVVLLKSIALALSIFAIILVNFLLYKERAGLFGRGVLIGGIVTYGILASALRYIYWLRFHTVVGKVDLKFLIRPQDRELLESDLKKRKFSPSYEIIQSDNLQNLKTSLEKSGSPILVMGVDPTSLNLDLQKMLFDMKLKGMRILDMSDFYEDTWANVPIYHLELRWFLVSEGFGMVSDQLRNRIKRLFDLTFSLVIFLLAWPVMLLAAIAIKLNSKGPLLYWQTRVGKNGENFQIVKFRSMYTDAEASGPQWAKKNDSRITKVGKVLRKTRIDELPQLWNVVKGQMSFIGPRPERPEFVTSLEKEIPFYQMRHAVRPGLTGWAQVCYPYGASVEDAKEKLQFEIYYIKHHSLWLDFLILLRTIKIVVGMRGT